MKKFIFLARQYNLVVGDEFEMFYRGIIRLNDPYKYYIHVECVKGQPYNRYFSYTPIETDEGSYPLTISLVNDFGEIIESDTTTLVVVKPVNPVEKVNILCFGDSLTVNGVWVHTGFSRFTKKLDNDFLSLGYENKINLLGTMTKTIDDCKIKYEGYGGWTFKSFTVNDYNSLDSSIWVDSPEHNLDESYQHQVFIANGKEWILETIEEKRLKFKRGLNNRSMVIDKIESFVAKNNHCMVKVKNQSPETGNPFYDVSLNDISFKTYAKKNQVDKIDYIYILLGWNNQYIPYNEKFDHHEPYIRKILDTIHQDFPSCKVRMIGIQVCSITGGMAANYGAHGPYSDTFGEVSTCFYFNRNLENLIRQDYHDFVSYTDLKAEFDTEYNMPYFLKKVNRRSSTTEIIGNNGVHPNMDGYLQIGDCFFRNLVFDLCKKDQK